MALTERLMWTNAAATACSSMKSVAKHTKQSGFDDVRRFTLFCRPGVTAFAKGGCECGGVSVAQRSRNIHRTHNVPKNSAEREHLDEITVACVGCSLFS